MRILLSIPVMGRLDETKAAWGTWLNATHGPVDLMIIENTGLEQERTRLRTFVDNFLRPRWPGDIAIHYMDDNIGLIMSMQYTYENSDHDVLAFSHNDVYIYTPWWDSALRNVFTLNENVGIVGFFGAEQVVQDGCRGYTWSNMLEAEIHGGRMERVGGVKKLAPIDIPVVEVAVLDGMSMFASRSMLNVRNGVDCEFDTHHFYDLDLSLESIDRGYKNYVLGCDIHHHSGVTACGPNFQEWAIANRGSEKAIYDANKARFMAKWKDYLPYRIGEPWGKREQ